MSKTVLYNSDCFEALPNVEDKSVNLFLLDLPYANKKFGNCTACQWDTPIDLEKMWVEIKRTMKPNGIIVFFCNTKFGCCLINSNPNWYKYDLIWEKSKKVGFLSANKMPLRKHENIYIFNNNSVTYSKKENYGTYNPQKTEGVPYSVKGGKSKKVDGSLSRGHEVISKAYENKGDRHPTSILPEFEESHENIYIFKDKQGVYNPQKTEGKPYKTNEHQEDMKIYNDGKKLKRTKKDNKGDRHPTSILPEFEESHENIYIFKDKQGVYNPQKTEGHKPYIDKRNKPNAKGYYREDGTLYAPKPQNNEGKQHPSSILPEFESTILKFNNPSKTIHRTQKPVDLLEWLIKTYSNEGDLVVDFCMGSGSCGIACMNTKRQFIGVEKDDDIFKLAQERINNHKLEEK